jgi:hypothetical protein
LVVVPALLAMRYAISHGFELGSYEIYFDKWRLGLIRLIDLSAVGILLIRAHAYLNAQELSGTEAGLGFEADSYGTPTPPELRAKRTFARAFELAVIDLVDLRIRL